MSRDAPLALSLAPLPSRHEGGPALAGIDPGLRLIATLAFAVTTIGLDRFSALLTALSCALAAMILARIEFRDACKRFAALDGVLILVLVTLPFSREGDAAFTILGLAASREGIDQALTILIRANAVLAMATALLATLDGAALGRGLGRLGASAKFVHLFLFSLRAIALLGEEYRRLRQAMRVRAFTLRFDRHGWRSMGYLVGMLLVRGVDRAERMKMAMRCRGFDGTFPTSHHPSALRAKDWVFALMILAVCSGLLLMDVR